MVQYGQKGYCGESMSEGAADAYAYGEKPRSRWTKAAILKAVEALCDELDLAFDDSVSRMKKDELWLEFIEWRSWHHTGKFANETDFYGLSERDVRARFRELSEAELAERRALRAAEQKAAEERLASERSRRLAIIEKQRDEQRAKYGFTLPIRVLDAVEANPRLFGERLSKSGNALVTWVSGGNEFQALKGDGKARINTWNAPDA